MKFLLICTVPLSYTWSYTSADLMMGLKADCYKLGLIRRAHLSWIVFPEKRGTCEMVLDRKANIYHIYKRFHSTQYDRFVPEYPSLTCPADCRWPWNATWNDTSGRYGNESVLWNTESKTTNYVADYTYFVKSRASPLTVATARVKPPLKGMYE